MMLRGFFARLSLLLIALLLLAGTGPVAAGYAQHPGPAEPEEPQAELWNQIDPAGEHWATSQDFSGDSLDSRAADDFSTASSPGVNSWSITAVEVNGVFYSPASPPPGASPVNVQFFADGEGGVPGALLYSATLNPADANNPDLFITLSSPLNLAANVNYWVSVQPTRSSGQWGWLERTAQAGSYRAAWANPGNGFASGCNQWGFIGNCGQADVGPDLGFRIHGSTSANFVAPILSIMTPDSGANRDVTVTILGANFVSGASVMFGSTPVAANVINSGRLTATIPASLLTSFGAVVAVTVNNPPPCSPCTSNALNFTVRNFVFGPISGK